MLNLMVCNVLCGDLEDCMALLSQHITFRETECS